MGTRRTTAALAAGCLALTTPGLAGLGAPATATTAAAVDQTPGYSLRHITVDVLVGPGRDQPCTVSADVYKPDGVSRRRTAPAVLTTHGFGGNKADERQSAYATGFVREGYVVLSYSGLGFGGSGCKIHLDDPQWDGRAGKQLVSVLAGDRPFTDAGSGRSGRIGYVAEERPGDPRVGMIGVSYGGEVQYSVAMQDKRVDALIPIITWNDLSYSLAPNNQAPRSTDLRGGVAMDNQGDSQGDSHGESPGVHKREWTALFFGLGILDGLDDPQVDPTRNVGCPNFTDEVCRAAAQLSAQGYPDQGTRELARHASVASYADRVTAPTLIVQGQRDTLFNLQEAVATFRALRRNGTEARMVWQQGGHSGAGAPGEFDVTDDSLRASYLGRRYLAWMDRHVRGDETAPLGPRFSYFRDWVDYDTSSRRAGRAVAAAYARRSSFSQAPTASLYFSGSRRLVQSPRHVHRGTQTYANAPGAPTSYSETSGLEGNQVNRPVSDQPGTVATYTSRALAAPADLVGSASLRLHLDAPTAAASQATGPGGRLILFAKVYDVAPDGTQTLKNRLVSPVRVQDVTAPVEVQLPGVVHRFRAGHRIRVVVAASDAAYANNTAVQPVTVTTAPDEPSLLRLPLTRPLRVR